MDLLMDREQHEDEMLALRMSRRRLLDRLGDVIDTTLYRSAHTDISSIADAPRVAGSAVRRKRWDVVGDAAVSLPVSANLDAAAAAAAAAPPAPPAKAIGHTAGARAAEAPGTSASHRSSRPASHRSVLVADTPAAVHAPSVPSVPSVPAAPALAAGFSRFIGFGGHLMNPGPVGQQLSLRVVGQPTVGEAAHSAARKIARAVEVARQEVS
jgi:hypothetical protein